MYICDKKYRFSWIFNRRFLIILVLLDFIFFISFLKNLREANISLNIIDSLIFLFIGYLFGRYEILKIKFQYSFFKYLKNTFLSLLCLILINFSLKVFFKVNFLIVLNDLDSKLLSIIILNSFLIQITLREFFKKFYYKYSWTFIGDFESYNLLKRICKNAKESNFHEFYFCEDINTASLEKRNGLIIQNKEILGEISQKIESEKVYNSEIITLNSWCKKYLELCNSQNLDKEEVFLIKNLDNKGFNLIKRIADILISLILIIYSLPIILIAGIFIKISDNGPIFYSQIRKGKNGKLFRVIKLRTMIVDAEAGKAVWSTKNDNRITFIGKYLRILRFDELPQLFLVFKGEMSLIGPRPERPQIDEYLEAEINFYKLRYKIKPGLSGWAQVNYPYGATLEDSKNKLNYDLYYILNSNLFLDSLIFFKTIKIVFNRNLSLPKT